MNETKTRDEGMDYSQFQDARVTIGRLEKEKKSLRERVSRLREELKDHRNIRRNHFVVNTIQEMFDRHGFGA